MLIKNPYFLAILGHILEKYDVTLYGFFTLVFAPIFFPSHDPTFSTILSMSTFAAGYLMRPLGGIIFGHIGDKLGRKKALLNSILFVIFPTLVIGLLPTYEQIGLFSPFILIFCRLFQGLCAGGEYSGATVFVFEHANLKSQGLSGSIVSATAFLGAMLGALVSSLTTYFFSSSWGWRIPFLLGGMLSIVIYFLRRNIIETPVFKKIKEEKKIINYPLFNILKFKKINILCVFLLGAQGHIILYLITIYMNNILIKILVISNAQIMLLNAVILINWIIFILIFGAISDKLNKAFILLGLSMGICIFSYPILQYLNNNFSIYNIVLVEIIFSFLGAGLFAITPGFLPNLFNVQSRYTGVAFGQTLGQALLGGTAPFIATYLSPLIGNINALIIVLVFSGLLGLLGIIIFFCSERVDHPVARER